MVLMEGEVRSQEECPESPNTHFCTQLCENHGIHRSGAVPAVTSCGARQVPGWVSCINGRLFLRLKFLLGPHRLAIFSCDSLKLEEVVNIEFPLTSSIQVIQQGEKMRNIKALDEEVGLKDWKHADEVINMFQWAADDVSHNGDEHSSSRSTTCVNLTAWNPALSDTELIFSDNESTCHRPQSVSCNPTSLIAITGASVAMCCIIPEKKRTMNRLSIGIARKGFAKNGACRAFGLCESSWGLYEDVANCSNVMYINACGTKVDEVDILEVENRVYIRYDRATGRAWLMVDRARGDFSRPVVKQEFTLHVPGDAIDDEYVMGAIYADDYRLKLLDIKPPYISEINDPTTPATSKFSTEPQRPAAIVVSASSNFNDQDLKQDGYNAFSASNNLLADDSTWDTEVQFMFNIGDVDQEITIHLRQSCKVVRVGSIFNTNVVSGVINDENIIFRVFVSPDGIEFFEFKGTMQTNSEGCASMKFLSLSDSELMMHHEVDYNIQYVRLRYGNSRHCTSAVRRIFIYGQLKRQDLPEVSMLPMTCDGINLHFLHLDTSDYDKKGYTTLQSFSVNPAKSFSDISKSEYVIRDFPSQLLALDKEKFMLGCLYASSGSHLIIAFQNDSHAKLDKNSACFCFLKLDCRVGVKRADNLLSTSIFSKEIGCPSALCYDARNNMIWAWSAKSMKFLRWRNDHLPQRLLCNEPFAFSDNDDLLLRINPYQRLKVFSVHPGRQTKENVQAGYLLTLLDKISVCYSYPDEPIAETEMLNQIEVSSGWILDDYFCKILIRGQQFGQCSDGFNFVILTTNFYPESFMNFKLNGGTGCGDVDKAVIEYIDAIPIGAVVVVAGHHNSTQKLSSNIQAALHSIGTMHAVSDSLVRYITFSIIGVKQGSKRTISTSSRQQIGENVKATLTMKQTIPPIFNPCSFECKHPTFSTLVQIIYAQWFTLQERRDCCESEDVSVLISAASLLTTNTIQLMASVHPSELQDIFNNDDRSTVTMITDQALKYVENMVASGNDMESFSVVLSMLIRLQIVTAELNVDNQKQSFLRLFEYFEKLLLGKLGGTLQKMLLPQLSNKFSPSYLSKCLLSDSDMDNSSCRDVPVYYLSVICKLLDIGEIYMKLNFKHLSSSGKENYGDVAQECLVTMCQVLLSSASQTIIAHSRSHSSPCISTNKEATTVTSMKTIWSIFNAVLQSSCNVLEWGLTTVSNFEKTNSDITYSLRQDLLECFESSCLKLLLPFLLSCLSLLMKHYIGEGCLDTISDVMIHTMNRFTSLFFQMKNKLGPTSTSNFDNHRCVKNIERQLECEVECNGNWLSSVENQVSHCFALVAVRMMSGTAWAKPVEENALIWMQNSLFASGFNKDGISVAADGASGNNNAGIILIQHPDEVAHCEIAQFLVDFFDRPEGSLASIFCRLMKRHIPEDQGCIDVTNRTVALCCAVLIKYHHLADEALVLAKQCRENGNENGDRTAHPSPHLCDLWKKSQSLRPFLQIGVVVEDNADATPGFTEKHGMSVRYLCNRVTKRAFFLLSNQQSSDQTYTLGNRTTPLRGEMRHSQTQHAYGPRWRHAMASGIAAVTPNSNDTDIFSSPLTSSVFDKGIAGHNTFSAKLPSLSETILQFLRSDVDLADLLKINTQRNRLATSRASGLTLLSSLLCSSLPSLFWVQWVTSSCRLALQRCPQKHSSEFHMLSAIEGCSSPNKAQVLKSFCVYLQNCLKLLSYAISNCLLMQTLPSSERSNKWCDIALSCLKSLCMDYSPQDIVLLHDSSLLSCLHTCLSFNNEAVRTTTRLVIELLFSRCWFSGSQSIIPPIIPPAVAHAFNSELMALTTETVQLSASAFTQHVCTSSCSEDSTNFSCKAKLSVPLSLLEKGGIQVLPDSPATIISRGVLGPHVPHVNIRGSQHSKSV